jgi:hypothetical protein
VIAHDLNESSGRYRRVASKVLAGKRIGGTGFSDSHRDEVAVSYRPLDAGRSIRRSRRPKVLVLIWVCRPDLVAGRFRDEHAAVVSQD